MNIFPKPHPRASSTPLLLRHPLLPFFWKLPHSLHPQFYLLNHTLGPHRGKRTVETGVNKQNGGLQWRHYLFGTNELRHGTEGASRENRNNQGDRQEHQPRWRDRRQTVKQREAERTRKMCWVCLCESLHALYCRMCACTCVPCHARVAGPANEFVFWSSQFPSGNAAEGDIMIRPHQPQGRHSIVFHPAHASPPYPPHPDRLAQICLHFSLSSIQFAVLSWCSRERAFTPH